MGLHCCSHDIGKPNNVSFGRRIAQESLLKLGAHLFSLQSCWPRRSDAKRHSGHFGESDAYIQVTQPPGVQRSCIMVRSTALQPGSHCIW